jgi:hypothetical protein
MPLKWIASPSRGKSAGKQNRGQGARLQLRSWLVAFRGEDRFRIGAGNFAHRNPADNLPRADRS